MFRVHRPRGRRGFTLIELLVVVLILAILMAIALPLYLSAVADSQKKTCRSNMQTIANAVQARYVKMAGGEAYFTGDVTDTDCGATGKLADLQAAPVCPKRTGTGASYAVDNTVTPFRVSCKIDATNHLTFQPGVNSQ